LGLFSRNRKASQPGDDESKEGDSVAQKNVATVNEAASAIIEEIKGSPAIDPSVWTMIREIARFYYDGQNREVSTITTTLVLSGYLLRKREIGWGAREIVPEETDRLLFSPTIESLGASITSGYEPGDPRGEFSGYKRTLFSCFNFSYLPFESQSGEDRDARSEIPGHSWFIRGGIELLLLEEFGWDRQDEESYLMSGEQVTRGAFGAGYMLHVFGEQPRSGWLDGLERVSG
jgi:hypothetical protein